MPKELSYFEYFDLSDLLNEHAKEFSKAIADESDDAKMKWHAVHKVKLRIEDFIIAYAEKVR